MADTSWQLLSRIVQHNALSEITSRRITQEMFTDPLQQRVFRFVQRHYDKYKKIPSSDLLGRKFPHAQVNLTVEEPTAYYIDQFLQQYLRANGADMLLRHAESLKDDPMKVLEALSTEAREMLGLGVASVDTRASENWRDRLKDYKSRAAGEMRGIPTPFETWNDVAMGWMEEDYTIITARPNVGKTFMMVYLLAHVRKLKQKALFFTKEMSVRAIQMREDAMLYGLPYKQLRRGELTEGQYRKYVKGMKRTARRVREGHFGESVYVHDAHLSVPAVAAKIEEHQPNIIFIDGLYLLTDLSNRNSQAANHEKLSNISRAIRALAQDYKVPIVGSSQIHRLPGNLEKNADNLTLGDVAFSDAFSQDPDMVYAIIRTVTDKEAGQLRMKCLKMREGETKDFCVQWDLNDPSNIKEIPFGFGDAEDDDEEAQTALEDGDEA